MERLPSMTEAGWEICINPYRMLGCLLGIGKATDRKLLLFASACAHRVWDHLSDADRDAVDIAERVADDEATWKELPYIKTTKNKEYHIDCDPLVNFVASVATKASEIPRSILCHRLDEASKTNAGRPERLQIMRELDLSDGGADDWRDAIASMDFRESAAQEAMIRDIFGNPFRTLPVIDPAWLTRDGGAIPGMAEDMNKRRDFKGMPSLADALEVAGCTSAELLSHLRAGGPHFRGCWVLDLLLGKMPSTRS